MQGGYSVARSQSAAGARSKSPRRSLSPPADRDGWRYTGLHDEQQPFSLVHVTQITYKLLPNLAHVKLAAVTRLYLIWN